jgi:nucleoside phosphorylase
MKVTTLRGVCIGIDQHLSVGDIADLDTATGKYLVSIGAVEEIKDEPGQPALQPESDSTSEGDKPSDPSSQQPESQSEPTSDKPSESKSKSKK